MTKQEVINKIKEILKKDSSLVGSTITITLIDKKTKKKTEHKVKIDPLFPL